MMEMNYDPNIDLRYQQDMTIRRIEFIIRYIFEHLDDGDPDTAAEEAKALWLKIVS